MQPALEQPLPADGPALVEEARFLDRLARVARREAIGDDEVALQEGTQDAVGEQETRVLEHGLRLLRRPGPRPPPRIEQPGLGLELVGEDALVGEEELVHEQLAQAQRLVPRVVERVGGVALRGVQGRQLDDRAVDEPVDRAVAVEGGDVVAVGLDGEDRLGPVRVRGHHARLGEPVEGRAHRRAAAQRRDALGHRQGPRVDIVEQRSEQRLDLRQRQRAPLHAEQGQRDQRRRHDRRHDVAGTRKKVRSMLAVSGRGRGGRRTLRAM